MSVIGFLHGNFVYGRRIECLSRHFAQHLPPDASVLDVGSGDGLLAARIGETRPDLTISGIDVLVRERTCIPVVAYDGHVIPHPDASFDAVIFVDVLHHVDDPLALLKEAKRVTRQTILIKDHLLEGFLAGPVLRLMDRVGNARYGVSLPFNYWPQARWFEAFDELGLKRRVWTTRLALYPRPLTWMFERSLHFFAETTLG